ncbi:peroxisomal membrane protein 11A [Diorhabda carinulata]|uniref:peroxisomal membrane protein 11A n=1 Tax=Diorhabda sublineata TaxID=1163346 RepID=UPI0024E124E3|nr:peroxisomal membrane protein 11A [Diorhabda sublineata]XP_057652746.1 peroxisomal membrane protein 11A [Diorhabda carinulata]
MDQLIKLNNQTAGRDKIARILQYLSRFIWHNLQKNRKNGVVGLKNLEFQLSTFRKLLRFGRFAESIYATLPLFHEEEATIRYSLILSKITNALFLLADHILWLGRADLCTVDTERWSNLSNRYWLYSITMNLVRDFYEISKLLKSNKDHILPKKFNSNDTLKILLRTFSILSNNQSIVIDTVKNSCDFFIPLTSLGHVKLSPGTIGLLGVISSVAGLIVLLQPTKKMVPS